MDERPGDLGGGEPREQQQQTREGAPQQQESESRGGGIARGRDERPRRDSRHHRGGEGGGRDARDRRGIAGSGGAGQSSRSQRPEASLNMDELRELFDLFTAQGFTEFELEKESFRIRLRRDLAPQASSGSQHLSPVPAQVLPFIAPPQQQQQPGQSSEEQGAVVQQQQQPQHQSAPAAEPEAAAEADLHVITSPIVGTFYRSPSPTSESFVRAGSRVEADTVVCIIEAMKLMNDILAEVSGTVEKIYVENGQPVEYGQPLFGIKK
jgi:acetyl-CoA carboxylase biotin carboxyl carrier protein